MRREETGIKAMNLAENGIKTLTPVEHIQTRLGMYMPTVDGKPTEGVWDGLLFELSAFGVRAFARGEASRMEINFNRETGALSFGHDAPEVELFRHAAKALDSYFDCEELQALCSGKAAQEACRTRYDSLLFTLVNALSAKFAMEVFQGDEWYSVTCRDGTVGPVERLMPELAEPVQGPYFNIRFTISPRFLPESENCPYSAKWLEYFADCLACAHPGLLVVVNGHEHLHRRGMEDFVTGRIGNDHADILMEAATFHCGGVSFSCGARKRADGARRIFGQMFINGLRVQSTAVLAMFSGLVCDWIGDAHAFRQDGYEFVFAVSGKLPYDVDDLDTNKSVIDICLSAGMDVDAMRYNPVLSRLISAVKRCMIDAFAGMRR